MAATTQPLPPVGGGEAPRALTPTAPPAGPNVDVQSTIDATRANLDAYLNEPVRDILARLGLAVPPGSAPPAPHDGGGPAPQGGAPGGGGSPAGGSPSGGSPMDPTQMIKPVTDALGTLGSGQYGSGNDPTQSLGGISQALDSAGSQVQQALSGVGSDWQGDAASAAQAKTQAALNDGANVSAQADALRENLTTATAAVAQAQARLLQIIDEYWAKIAAIGPSIIFPWGIAAAIAAATQAVTETSEVMSETEATLTTLAAGVTAQGTPVSVTDAPTLGAGGGAAAGQALSPMMQLASTAVSPVMQAVGTAASSAGSGGASAASATPAATPLAGAGTGGATGGGHGAAGAGRGVGGAALTAPSRLASASAATVTGHADGAASVQSTAAKAASGGSGGGGGPMGGGAGMAHPSGKAGLANGHQAADFLHTSDQGGEIVGDLGDVAPPVIGEKDPLATPATGR